MKKPGFYYSKYYDIYLLKENGFWEFLWEGDPTCGYDPEWVLTLCIPNTLRHIKEL